jgi:3-oxoacyl-[acyl-carrier protein] reductase
MTQSTRRAVVTGGGTGIGRAIAAHLARSGHEVVIIGRRQHVLEEAAAAINEAASSEPTGDTPPGRVTWATADLTDPEAVASLAKWLATAGPVDVLVNNAGGIFGSGGESLADTATAWEADFRGNVLTAVLLTEALLPHLARPGGRIIGISSIAGLRGAGSYGAAKAAMHAWAMSLATSVAADGITVNIVAPGFVPDTEFWRDRLTDQVVQSRLAQIPLGRPGTPEEIAAAVGYLAAPDAGWTTGQILQVNGGALFGRG